MRRILGFASSIIALSLLLPTIAWPTWAEATFHSRLAVAFATIWFAALVLFLRPELTAGWRHGIAQFRKASKEVSREVDDDDDDPPQPA